MLTFKIVTDDSSRLPLRLTIGNKSPTDLRVTCFRINVFQIRPDMKILFIF